MDTFTLSSAVMILSYGVLRLGVPALLILLLGTYLQRIDRVLA